MDNKLNWSPEIFKVVEIIQDQLYFAVIKDATPKKLRSTIDSFYFTVDEELVYHNYYNDFGPLNISCLYKYCYKLNKYLEYAKGLKRIVHYTINVPEKKANAAFLIGAFCVIYLNKTPKEMQTLLTSLGYYKPFVDASQYANQYTISLIDCFQALAKACTFNFFDFDDFNVSEYDTNDKIQFGDMNWLLPRKFMAFISPTESEYINGHSPQFYVKYFLKNDVKTVIRLNNPTYDAASFTGVGIQHFDLIFPDGSTPPKDILLKFLYITENAPAAVAVHCKAGLGRTGSLIGAFLVKHYHLSAKEAIAWMRICRPGSVIGQQQCWLETIEAWLWRSGAQFRMCNYGDGDKIPCHRCGIYSKSWPKEREKIIREARKKIQSKFTNSQLEKLSQKKRQSVSVNGLADATPVVHKCLKSSEGSSATFSSISHLINSVQGLATNCNNLFRNITVLTNEPQNNVTVQTSLMSKTSSDVSQIEQHRIVMLTGRNTNNNTRHSTAVGTIDEANKNKNKDITPQRKTQGDKLNAIKIARSLRAEPQTSVARRQQPVQPNRRFV